MLHNINMTTNISNSAVEMVCSMPPQRTKFIETTSSLVYCKYIGNTNTSGKSNVHNIYRTNSDTRKIQLPFHVC